MKKEAVRYFYDLGHFLFRFVKIINSLPKLDADIIICNVFVRANTAELIANRRTTLIFKCLIKKLHRTTNLYIKTTELSVN